MHKFKVTRDENSNVKCSCKKIGVWSLEKKCVTENTQNSTFRQKKKKKFQKVVKSRFS